MQARFLTFLPLHHPLAYCLFMGRDKNNHSNPIAYNAWRLSFYLASLHICGGRRRKSKFWFVLELVIRDKQNDHLMVYNTKGLVCLSQALSRRDENLSLFLFLYSHMKKPIAHSTVHTHFWALLDPSSLCTMCTALK